eukprot:1157478-Pelagomonas_calceolata.AAC.8
MSALAFNLALNYSQMQPLANANLHLNAAASLGGPDTTAQVCSCWRSDAKFASKRASNAASWLQHKVL